MRIVKESIPAIATLLGTQEMDLREKYRPITFCRFAEADAKELAYNVLTGEVILPSAEESSLLHSDVVLPTEQAKELIGKRFLVPVEHDDIALVDEIASLLALVGNRKEKQTYVIFTTLDCNARCFYCYERGCKKSTMTAETAEQTAAYILKTAANKGPVSLQWFGGEPLCNIDAIDTIADRLRAENIEYTSSITTNAYLFDPVIVKKAKEKWNLKKAQITLDGTEKEYNRIKAYVDSAGKNPFGIVTDNIEVLLQQGIEISLRVHFGKHNIQDLYALADILAERYGAYHHFSVEPHLLVDTEKVTFCKDSQQAATEMIEFIHYCAQKGIAKKQYVHTSWRFNCCMADAPNTVVILPDGHLGKCEGCVDQDFIGTLEEGITDLEKVEWFKRRLNSKEECQGCPVYPVCIRLQCCNKGNHCTEAYKMVRCAELESGIKNTYAFWKEKQKTKAE